MKNVLEGILEEIKPTSDEENHLEKTCKRIKDTARKFREEYGYEPLFCGSISKDTWLRSKKDIDLFLLFDEEVSREDLEEKGNEAAKKIIDNLDGVWDIAYAEHPYVQGKINGYEVDIVPAYDVNADEIKSSVDRTPWHVRWIENNLNHNQTDQVRLLKKFCKEHGLYGSDLKTEGFSGYLCELLIAEYGDFENLVKEAKDWKSGHVVDPAEHFKSESYLRNDKFEKSVLITIDPVDKDRNVASVLSSEKFFMFRKAAREFVENPDRETFFGSKEREMPMHELKTKIKARGTDFLLVKFNEPDAHQDVIFPQMRKMNDRIEKVLEEEGFEVMRKDVWNEEGKCVLILELEVDELPRVDKRVGPSVFDRRNSKRFVKRYKGEHNLLIEDDKWVTEYWRESTSALDFVRKFLDDSAEELQEKGVPKHLAEMIADNVEIGSGHGALRIFRRYPKLRVKMNEYFEKDLA
ncbi:MAG: CCA tRNA nucleotidyltransferase [Candidatus Aenigmatarchaeota archaeon]